ncbi:50S ribosomal protein L25 [Pleurocapsa sp. CCALA 161]|uniref:50S ribosomal protein L25/general stress protein Ctc n=1 Tax=Pleurocapsa sp. CCALA 161 TaxID=2107688 RepID=UPI000D0485F8|nr:50S ribosomal protein L25/general stress protein Ctc [Pleurocapsa sp. CCALA 161]PSB09245.1 50S ribosomal protein L25 [Pleurocapsa sp. CCALA 161]
MNISVECKSRPEGSKPRALRREGLIPAALYGHDGANSISLTIPAKEAQLLLRDAAINNTLIDLNVPDLSWKGKALIREVQAHPWKRTLHHLSFFTVSAKQQVEIVVPIILTGKAAGTKEGGIVDQIMTELKIICAADSIPESIEIDVTNFEIGSMLQVGDIVLPDGAEVLDDPERTAISIVLPAKAVGTEDTEVTEGVEQSAETVTES